MELHSVFGNLSGSIAAMVFPVVNGEELRIRISCVRGNPAYDPYSGHVQDPFFYCRRHRYYLLRNSGYESKKSSQMRTIETHHSR